MFEKRFKFLKVTLVRSPIGTHKKVRESIQNLGLKRTNKYKIHKDNDAIRGLVNKVIQYVHVEGLSK